MTASNQLAVAFPAPPHSISVVSNSSIASGISGSEDRRVGSCWSGRRTRTIWSDGALACVIPGGTSLGLVGSFWEGGVRGRVAQAATFARRCAVAMRRYSVIDTI